VEKHVIDHGNASTIKPIALEAAARVSKTLAKIKAHDDKLARIAQQITLPRNEFKLDTGLIPCSLAEYRPDPIVPENYFEKTQVYTTMELRMKCGVGKCGRCNIGDKYVCKDGPVFRFDELDELPDEY
jgi:hypothetical protein